jgi:hypothetical protein
MSGNARDAEDDGEGALREDGAGRVPDRVPDMPAHLVSLAQSLSKMLVEGPDKEYSTAFVEELVNAIGHGDSLPALRATKTPVDTSTGSVQAARSYVTIEERVHEDKYRGIIYTLVKGAMASNCTWEIAEESAWDHKLTSHDASHQRWYELFQAGKNGPPTRDEKQFIKELYRGRRSMTLCRQYLTSHRHDPLKLRDKLEAKRRASQKDKHHEWPQNKLILIIGRCRNLSGAVESDKNDTQWYVIGRGEVFCPGGDLCECPSGMIKIKAESVESRWYEKNVHGGSVADCAAGGDDERGSDQAATRQPATRQPATGQPATRTARPARKEQTDNLGNLRRVDVAYQGTPPELVINTEEPFLWFKELIAFDVQGDSNLRSGRLRHDGRGRRTGHVATSGAQGKKKTAEEDVVEHGHGLLRPNVVVTASGRRSQKRMRT